MQISAWKRQKWLYSAILYRLRYHIGLSTKMSALGHNQRLNGELRRTVDRRGGAWLFSGVLKIRNGFTPGVQPYASMHSAMMMHFAGRLLEYTNVLLCSSWAQQCSSWVLNTYTFTASRKVEIFAEKNSKIASVMSCQRSDLWTTLKYNQSRDFEAIQWILWTRRRRPWSCVNCCSMVNRLGRRLPHWWWILPPWRYRTWAVAGPAVDAPARPTRPSKQRWRPRWSSMSSVEVVSWPPGGCPRRRWLGR